MIKKKKQSYSRFKRVISSALIIRSEPLRESFDINTLFKDDIVECDRKFKNADWDHISTEDGKEGFCMKKFLEPIDPDICDGKICISKENGNDKEN